MLENDEFIVQQYSFIIISTFKGMKIISIFQDESFSFFYLEKIRKWGLIVENKSLYSMLCFLKSVLAFQVHVLQKAFVFSFIDLI